MVSRQKEVDMSRGILQLEQDILEWNRNNLMQHMGYTNYRDVDTFVKTLISNNHVNVRREGKKEFYRTTGSGEIWLDNKKEGGSNVETAAGDNISILIDRFGCNRDGLSVHHSLGYQTSSKRSSSKPLDRYLSRAVLPELELFHPFNGLVVPGNTLWDPCRLTPHR